MAFGDVLERFQRDLASQYSSLYIIIYEEEYREDKIC